MALTAIAIWCRTGEDTGSGAGGGAGAAEKGAETGRRGRGSMRSGARAREDEMDSRVPQFLGQKAGPAKTPAKRFTGGGW